MGIQIKKVVKGQQYPANTTPSTPMAGDKVAPTLPITGKGQTSVEGKPPA